MSFVMIATGPASCSRVRTVSLRALLAAGGLGALALVAGGVAVGYWLLPAGAVPALVPVRGEHPAARVSLEQLGALSGRLFRLENQAAQLGERIGVPAARKPGSGGPLLPARPSADSQPDLKAMEDWLGQVERQIAQLSAAAAQRNLVKMTLPTRTPIVGAELVSGFGNRIDPFRHHNAFHAGLDFAADQGTPIKAAAGGTVAFAGYRSDYGWSVEIDHGNGLTTRYAHASKLLVKAGAVVTPGQQLALVGSTGRSTGAHLHFEVLRDGEPTDPREYLAGL